MRSTLLASIIVCAGLVVGVALFRWWNQAQRPPTEADVAASRGFARTQPGESPKPSDNLTSIVLLLNSPRELSEIDLRQAAERAFGHPFSSDGEFIAKATSRTGLFILSVPQLRMGLITSDAPYYADVAAAADALREFRAKRAVQEHKAWLSVDLVGDPPDGGAGAAYTFLAKLAGQFADERTLAILRTSDGLVVPYQPEFSGMLSGGKLDAVFGATTADTVIKTEKDDPELKAAAEEARRRWPEFIDAFGKRKPLQGFGVKKAFKVNGAVEHMWVEVSGIQGQSISGKLNNDPETLTQMKIGDTVTLDASEVEDWVYSDGKAMVGGFQIKVLQNRGR